MFYIVFFITAVIVTPLGWSETGAIANSFIVKEIRTDINGRGYIVFNKSFGGTPASCASDYNHQLAFDLNTEGGKGILSLALSAKAMGKTIFAKGTGSCSVYGVVEDWNWGKINE